MKKAILALAVMALVGGSFTSCKKGENDPFLSLKSRKGRITGEWNVSSGTTTITNSGSSSGSATRTYTSTTRTDVNASNGASNTDVFNYTQVLTIEKDGSFSMVVTDTKTSSGGVAIDAANQTTNTSTISGIWQFLKKSKEGEYKNKEAVSMTTLSHTWTSVTNGTTTSGSITNTGFGGTTEVKAIDQLKNKEMILLTESSWSDGTDNQTTTGTITYEKQ